MTYNNFRTTIKFKALSDKISHRDSILSIGSCFSENIAQILKNYKFNVTFNPTGVLYNPLSISDLLNNLIAKKIYSKEDLFLFNGLYHSFDHHTKYAKSTIKDSLKVINKDFNNAQKILYNLDVLILTLGTSFTYKIIKTNKVVANCHKLPNDKFSRELTDINTITHKLKSSLEKLIEIRPNIKIILTISPVRHLRDNAHENQISKAYLISAVHLLENDIKNIFYFPSYEIMMDDLRDYRFYADDMVHPSETAVNYIWDILKESCIADDSLDFIKEYSKIIKSKKHKIINSNSTNLTIFKENNIKTVQKLSEKFPYINLKNDFEYFSNL